MRDDLLITHWGRVMHICVSNPTIIGSDNGLLPVRRQTIIWTNDGILFIGPLGTWIFYPTFSFRKKYLKISSGKWRSFCFGLSELITTMSLYYSNLTWLAYLTDKLPGCQWSRPEVTHTGNVDLPLAIRIHFSHHLVYDLGLETLTQWRQRVQQICKHTRGSQWQC